MNSGFRHYAAALAALSLVACVTTRSAVEPLAEGDFSMSGRVLVRQGERADVLRIYWSHVAQVDEVRLETPLGQTVAELSLDPVKASAHLGDGRAFETNSDSELAERVIGTPVPLRRFADWLRAAPRADASVTLRDDSQRVLAMRDAGWQLNYSGYGALAGLAGPSLVEAKREDVVVRVKIESWQGGASK